MKTLHFIGIGGIGMSGIARLYLAHGHQVQGSDAKTNGLLTELEALGARIHIGHDPSHVQGADVVVYSSSIGPDHPERVEALRLGIPVLHRSQALAELCRGRYTIAVTGTHGKTTTTSLIGMVLKEAGREPSIVVGGVVKAFGGNACWGSGREMVIEADESDASFLNFSPDLAVITNIEEEHLDHYKDIGQIEKAFGDFLARLSPKGQWFGCAEEERIHLLSKKNPRVQFYGFQKGANRLYARQVQECPDGARGVTFEAWRGEERLGEVRMNILGRHNVLNALAAVGVGLKLGIPFTTIASALQKFEGAGRRFDVRYEDRDYLVVDDYAHHPTEIQKTLEAARALKKNRIVALFQPHRYSRTELLLAEFGRSFSAADKLILTDIYAASEQPRPGITGMTLYEEVLRSGHPDTTFAQRDQLMRVAKEEMRPGDLVLIMGAGDISQVAGQLSDHLSRGVGGQNPFSSLRGRVLVQEPISRHTSLRIGGPAEYWIEPADIEDLQKALAVIAKHSLKLTLIGAGSNLLAPDAGLKGAVVHLGQPFFKQIWMKDGLLHARTGVPNSLFIQFALDNGLGGCEFLMGIPGNIGGAIAMNAGSHGQWIGPRVQSVTTVGYDGQVRKRAAGEVPFSYRYCGLQNEVLVEAGFLLPHVPKEESLKRLEEYRQYRVKTQDLRYPSAGCMFKNPDIPGCSSGRLIDQAGLKGLRVGNAQVSDKHANFIVNLGGATAKDIVTLIGKVRRVIKEKHDIDLETEVKILS